MQIGILQCGDAPPSLAAAHGTYGEMVRGLVAEAGTARVLDVTRGELPAEAEAFDAYVLTGSPAGVYDPDPWIGELMTFLKAARGRTKLVGICFGHQAMAQAFGGEVIKSPKGWGLGVQRYDVGQRSAWMDDAAAVAVPASHQDQVVVRPPDARVILKSGFTPYAGLDYGDAISFQPHPEFTPEFGVALLEVRRKLFGDRTDAAIASYAAADDRARIAGWIRRFLAG